MLISDLFASDDNLLFDIIGFLFMIAGIVFIILSVAIKNREKLFITLSVIFTWISGSVFSVVGLMYSVRGLIPMIILFVFCAFVLVMNLILKDDVSVRASETSVAQDGASDGEPTARSAEETDGKHKTRLKDKWFGRSEKKDGSESSNGGGKPLSMLKATARYNLPGYIGEIAGPITGFDGLRVKRVSKIKGKIVLWEAKCVDEIIEDGDIDASSAVVWGLNFPHKVGPNEISYCSYIDVKIKGRVNRIMLPVAKIPGPIDNTLKVMSDIKNGRFPFKTSQRAADGVPVVSGWVKDPSRPKDIDEHYDDPICPEGYLPLVLGYYRIQPLFGGQACLDLGLPKDLLKQPEYIREKEIKFSSIPDSSDISSEANEVESETSASAETASTPKIVIGKREFSKGEIEQLFAYFWVHCYNQLEFADATEKITGYFSDNNYIDEKTIAQTDVVNLLSFIWASKYNTLPYDEAILKIVEHLSV